MVQGEVWLGSEYPQGFAKQKVVGGGPRVSSRWLDEDQTSRLGRLLRQRGEELVHVVGRAQFENVFLDHARRRDTSSESSVASLARRSRGWIGLGCMAHEREHEDVVLLCFSCRAAYLLARRHRSRGGVHFVSVKQVHSVRGFEGALFVHILWYIVFVADYIQGIEAQYWKHCELFPTTFTVTKDVTGELKDILLQAAADRLLVKFSTSPYDKDALEYMLNVVKEIEVDVREGSGHAAWIIDDGVLRSSYGQTDDYFDIEDTGPKIGPYRRPILLTVLAPLFLRSPDMFAAELHSFHESFTLARWSNFVHKVDQSIRDSNLLATVLLTTNVGLLAWSDGGKKGGMNSPTAAQIVTYISIICSVGSIIIGLAIFKQYRAKGADTPLRAVMPIAIDQPLGLPLSQVVVLRRILKEPFGLERLAIICSLPYVLLMWGLIAFLAAFGIIFYEDTPIQVRIPVTIALFVVVLFLFFCMYTAGPPEREDPKPRKQSCREKVAFVQSLIRGSRTAFAEIRPACPLSPA
ncbi:hypothetical protein JVT61DRAFT_926 [Boletus reticuloceps]|uniref:Uncharacterized protein n=1 Tax=Boletus reticuloceps TaxID=495285 RepID=A0A8I3A9I8_9AGAM|nr:hypothetical protein JVT61DRAFT_926 [Boletus reticuloceps]